MIFVTVGTTYRFDSLIKAVHKIAPTLNEKVVIQIGKSEYTPKNCQYFRFKPSLIPYHKQASLVISHGGAGTTFEVLKLGKRLISVENPNVNDEHQSDLLRKLSKEKYILWCKNLERLYETIKEAKNFKFKKYKAPSCEIANAINGYLGERK